MANEKRLIDANAFKMFLEYVRQDYLEEDTFSSDFAAKVIETVQDEYLANAPTVDAVEISTVDLWLREIAMNSMKMANPMDNPIPLVCAMLIERLDGLREFARERKDAHE